MSLDGPPCVWCSGRGPRQVAVELQDGLSLSRCGSCGAVALWPPPDNDELARAYAATYYGESNRRFIQPMEVVVRWFRAARARDLDRRARRRAPAGERDRPSRALDVGCGRGFLLADLRALGWVPRGVERSGVAAQHARDQLGLTVDVGEFAELPLPAEGFDCVIFWHVLEHLRDPAAALRRSASLLTPGGLLVVAVPNLASWQASWGGASWFHLDPPRHLHHCEAHRLRHWLEANGFAVLQVDHLNWEQNPYGWLQTLLNRIGRAFGWPANLFYDLLKRAGAKSSPQGSQSALRRFVVWMAAAAALPLAISLSLAEAVARRGGTIEIYAVRSPESKAPSSG